MIFADAQGRPLEPWERRDGQWRPLYLARPRRGTAPPGPPAPTNTLLGAYMGSHSENPDERYRTAFGQYPDLMSQYYQQAGSSAGRLNIAQTQARADRGTIPVITVRSHNQGGPMPYTMEQIASGAADSWINQWADDLNAVNTPRIIFTFDHEAEVKRNEATTDETAAYNAARSGGYTGTRAQWIADLNSGAVTTTHTSRTYPLGKIPTLEAIAAAYNRFCGMIRAACPHVQIAFWYGYFDTASINTLGSSIIRPDLIMPDPYVFRRTATAQNQTFEQMVTGKVTNWLFARDWYDGQPVIFGEFAKDTGFGDADCAEFYRDLPSRMTALGVSGGLLFNRNKGGDVIAIIDDGNFPLARNAYTASAQAARPT